jgi:hypothetical protein
MRFAAAPALPSLAQCFWISLPTGFDLLITKLRIACSPLTANLRRVRLGEFQIFPECNVCKLLLTSLLEAELDSAIAFEVIRTHGVQFSTLEAFVGDFDRVVQNANCMMLANPHVNPGFPRD